MEVPMSVRRASSQASLERLLGRVESGRETKPDWLELRGDARLERVPDAQRPALLRRLHAGVLRGLRWSVPREASRRRRLALWREVASHGFHDFGGSGFAKCYDAPEAIDYDYLRPYVERGLRGLDPYAVYSSVLGTHDYGVEDFLHTALGEGVRTVVEPMAGSAEFAWHGHFRYPDFRYVMFDLDRRARRKVMARRWLPETERHYVVADVLDEAVWQQVKSLTTGRSLCYVGKQSHHFFGARDLLRLLELATNHTDLLLLEVPPPSLIADLPEEDDLTRPEMEDAGLQVLLVDEPGGRPNPVTNRMAFRLEARDRSGRRVLFRYPGWTFWQIPMLHALAELAGVRMLYFHSGELEFVPPERGTDDSDLGENVTFAAFTRHRD